MDQRLLEVRRRLRDDYRYYAKSALKIRTKEGTIAPLVLRPAQNVLQTAVDQQLAANLPVRIIILKARQQGLSTHVGGFLYFQVSQRDAAKAMVVAHKADSTQTLFDMTKRYHENVPALLKPHTKYSSRRELVFDLLDSSYTVATAGGDGIARGETITHLHASELAFWPASSAKENWNGLRQSVPEVPGTAVFIESTANGVSGLFYELWQGAVAGTNGYLPVFIPWFLDPGYRTPAPEGFERTPDEQKVSDLAKAWDIDLHDDQLYWRRRKIAESGVDLFKQEYPATPDEAFLTSGRPVFNPEQLTERVNELGGNPGHKDAIDVNPALLKRMALQGDTWEEHPRGELWVYHEYDPAESYTIGADVGMGVRNGDWSVAQVLDSNKRQVAKYRAQVHPDYYAAVLNKLGLHYNTAKLIVENNNHGILTCHLLGKEYAYPDLYQEVQHDKITDKETVKLGFTTTVKTKPLIIDDLRAEMRDGKIEVNDKNTLREMLTYVVTESGKMEAEADCHDDEVMSLALANYVHDGVFKPIANEDNWYVEMI